MSVQSEVRVRNVVVIGAGIMGLDIAAIFLANGVPVDLVQRDGTKHDRSRELVAQSVAQMKAVLPPGLLSICCDLDGVDWHHADLAVETVPENLEVKRAVFADLAGRVQPHTVVGSNASGLPISAITEGLDIAAQSVGLHFFLPANLVPLVEVVCGARTDIAFAERGVAIMKAVGRVPVLVRRDTPGFLANRIQHALMREVFAVLDEGLATPDDVDAAVQYGFGMRYVAAGPLMQKEFAGLDTQLAAATSVYPALSTNKEPAESLVSKVRDGHFGIKTLKGFWNWTEDEALAARSEFRATLMATVELLKEGRRKPEAKLGEKVAS